MKAWKTALLFALISALSLGLGFILACGSCGDDSSASSGQADDDDSVGVPTDDDIDDDSDDDVDDDTDDDDDDDTGDDDTVQPCDWAAHDALILAGKNLLSTSAVYEGYETFADAWDLCPDSIDARMGLALSCQLELERSSYEAIRWYLSGGVPEPPGEEKSVGSILQSLLENHFRPKAEEFLTHARAISDAPDEWSFYIESYPFIVQGELIDEVIVDLGGEWDKADGIIMEAEAELYLGLGYFLCAHDLTTDGAWGMGMPDFTGTVTEIIHELSAWLLTILNDTNYPQFFTLIPATGALDVANAADNWGAMYFHFHEGFNAMLAEIDDQEDDIFGYVDENGNNRFDDQEPYRLPYFGSLSPTATLALHGMVEVSLSLAYSTWDTGGLDAHPLLPDFIWLSEFNFLLEALGLLPILPPIPFRFGPLYYDPGDTVLKDGLRVIMTLLYELTEP